MELRHSVSLARRLVVTALLAPLAIGVWSCGSGGGGGGGGRVRQGSGNPTDLPDVQVTGPLLLDLDALSPAGDVAAAQGVTVPFAVVLGPEHNPDLMTYRWALDGDPVGGDEPEIVVETSRLELGIHIVSLTLLQGETDEKEAAKLSWRLQVTKETEANRPPIILQALPPGGVALPRGDEIDLGVAALDVDAGDEIHYRWSVDGDRVDGDGATIRVDSRQLSIGAHSVMVEVRDGARHETGETSSFTWTLDVKDEGEHSFPYLSGAWPVGSPRLGPDGRFRFEVEAEVPDAEDLVRFRWEVDGMLQKAEGNVFHFEPDSGESDEGGGPHRVTCRLIAGLEEAGEAGAAVGWTVRRENVEPSRQVSQGASQNSPPIIASVSPGGETRVIPGETRVFRVSGSDPDGDILTYRWLVDGLLAATDGPIFAYTGSLDRGGSGARVEVRVSDGRSGHDPSPQSMSAWDIVLAPMEHLALTLSSSAITLDNGQAGTSSTGDWSSSSAGGAYGTSSFFSKTAGDTYTYSLSLPAAARHEVLLWWTVWSSRAPSVAVKIYHSEGTSTVTVNQTLNGGRWNSLGFYDFSSTAKVVIASVGGGLSTCADAVCLNPASSTGTLPGDAVGDPVPGEIVIDDGAPGTSSQGTWSPSSAPNPYGGRSLYARTSGSYTFQRTLTAAASYDVYAWWTEWPSRDGAVPYEISYSSGTATVRKDQRISGGAWNYLGRYSFGASVKVTVRVPSDATACADAVRFIPASGSPPPPDDGGTNPGDIVVDNGSPGTTFDGVWSPSSAPNPYGSSSLYAKDRGAYVYDIALPSSGTYGVYVWYTEWSSRESAVPYEIRHSSGTGVVKVDQRTGGGRWTPLGDFTFGTTARITVRVVDTNTVCADAVRLVPGGGAGTPVESPAPPPASSTPQITELAAFALTPTLARVSWRTNFLGSSVVSYGTTSAASDLTRSITGARWDHSVLLENLSSDRLYYVRVKSANGSVSRSSETVSFRTPDSTPSYTISSSHPRIFFNQGEIPSIRDRIRSAPYDAWWSSILSFSNQQLGNSVSAIANDYPRTCTALAFAGLIGDVPSYRGKAISVAMSVAGLSSSGDNKELRRRIDFILPVYDWLHAYLTSSQRSALRSKLASHAAQLEAQVKDTEYADGHSNGNQNGAFLAALGIYGEDTSAPGIISRALVRYNEGFWAFWREHGSENGGSFKSGWYTTVATEFNYEVFAAWKSATGKNLYQTEKVWFAGLADWYLHSLRGDLSWDRHGDVIFQQGVDEVERHILIQIAREYKSTDAQWLGGRILDFVGVWGPDMVLDILWYDASVPEKAPVQALSRHFKGSGMVMARQSWKDDAVKATFRAVPYYMGGHGHLDQCSFAIFYKEGLALDSGVYDEFGSSHHLSYYSRSIAHNAILVTDPDEVFKLYGETNVADGGQYWLDPQRVPHPFPEVITDLTNDDSFDLGGVKLYEDTDLYTYAVGDGTPSYNPAKLAAYFRHFLWLKSLSGWTQPVVLVFDEVEATKSTFKKTYLLHTTNKPAVSGTLVSAASGAGLLYQRTVFPQSPAIALVGGAGREYWVKDRNYPPSRSPKPGEEAGAWRVEVSPTASRLHDEFLHVLYPTDAGKGAPPSVRAIDAASMKGLETQGLVILFAVKLESVPGVSYSLTGSRRNVLFGLSPSRVHDIYLDGVKKETRTSSVSGTLDFTNPSAGKVEVIRK